MPVAPVAAAGLGPQWALLTGLVTHKQAVWVELCPQRGTLEPCHAAQALTYGPHLL